MHMHARTHTHTKNVFINFAVNSNNLPFDPKFSHSGHWDLLPPVPTHLRAPPGLPSTSALHISEHPSLPSTSALPICQHPQVCPPHLPYPSVSIPGLPSTVTSFLKSSTSPCEVCCFLSAPIETDTWTKCCYNAILY